MNYTHLTILERACIANYYKDGLTISQIALLLDKDKSTISRELKRNPSRYWSYNAIGAQRKYYKRRKRCVKQNKLLTNQNLYLYVVAKLNLYLSPDQIVNALPPGYSICTSSIYRALEKDILLVALKSKQRRYGKQLKHKKKPGIGYDFSSVRTIAQRDPKVLIRNTYGH